MKTRSILTIFAVVVLTSTLAACGEEEAPMSFEGTYEVIQHTRNNSGCESAGTAVASGDPYFRLEERNGTLAYISCSSATECEQFANDTLSLEERDGDMWLKTIASATGDEDLCELQYVERKAEPARNGIELNRRKLENSFQMPEFECTDSAARERTDQLECTETETIVAVPAGA